MEEDLIEADQELIVTEPKATRFFWTVDQALDLIYDCLDNAVDSKPYVPSMKAMSIENLLDAMYEKYLPEGGEKKIKVIGLQPGENFHEKILEDGEDSSQAEQYTVEQIIPLI